MSFCFTFFLYRKEKKIEAYTNTAYIFIGEKKEMYKAYIFTGKKRR